MGLFKKKKKTNKIKEFISKEEFKIPQIDETDTLEGLKKQKEDFNTMKDQFASPIFGNNVKDDPANIDVHGLTDVDSAYDAFRSPDKKVRKDDDYRDFRSGIVTNEMGRKILGYTDLKDPVGKNGGDKYSPVDSVKSEGFDFSKHDESEIIREPIYVEPTPTEIIDDYEFDSYDKSKLSDPVVDEKQKYEEAKRLIREYEKEHNIKPEKPVRETPVRPQFTAPTQQEPQPSRYVADKPKQESQAPKRVSYAKYKFPPKTLYKKQPFDNHDRPTWVDDQIKAIDNTLSQFGIDGHVENFTKGPTVTRYEIRLEPGVNVNKVNQIQNNLLMNLSTKSIRIESPIPGKPNVGIEVPNIEKASVPFGNIVTDEFLHDGKPLRVALGLNIEGHPVYVDIAKMPHGLIAGTTGSGKSVSVNTILASLLLKNTPDDLRMILVDPKQVEFIAYSDIPHLITPVITDARMASEALKWTVEEMERRYKTFRDTLVRDIVSYNEKVKDQLDTPKMPYIVVVIDELADLMNVASNDVETSLQRLTQKSRACGIHLLLATQRPTVQVIKGTIKTNIPFRMAFRVSSFTDSTTILDQAGAETLLGYGDMLMKNETSLERIQGAYISDDEIFATVDHIKNQYQPNYVFGLDSLEKMMNASSSNDEDDPLFEHVARFVVEFNIASINRVQKEFNLGFNRAQKIFEMLDAYGITTGGSNGKQREVIVTMDELEAMLAR